jgi:hypothetical protein
MAPCHHVKIGSVLQVTLFFPSVYETCKLGTHSPQSLGNHMEMDAGKSLYTGFVLLDCPQSMKIESSNASLVGSISDYFLSLSNGWDLASYLKSLSKAVKALKIGPSLLTNPKEGSSSSCMVSSNFYFPFLKDVLDFFSPIALPFVSQNGIISMVFSNSLTFSHHC